jgi:DnaJ homologue, subfamily C, member 28, conserved domain
MTERKPPETSFPSWIDQQIAEAEKRGAFDNLPGAGKPIPDRGETDYVQVWLREYLRREGVSAEELLPTPLKLRKEIERLAGAVQELRSEQEVRETVRDLNRRIMEWRLSPVGPPIFVPLVEEEKAVSGWRHRHTAGQPSPPPADTGSAAPVRAGWPRRLARLWRR